MSKNRFILFVYFYVISLIFVIMCINILNNMDTQKILNKNTTCTEHKGNSLLNPLNPLSPLCPANPFHF
jgi:hypothetical protein